MDNGQGVGLLKDPAVLSIAAKHSKSPAQILLRWGVERGNAIIPKTSSEGRLEENINIFDFELDEKDMEEMVGAIKEVLTARGVKLPVTQLTW